MMLLLASAAACLSPLCRHRFRHYLMAACVLLLKLSVTCHPDQTAYKQKDDAGHGKANSEGQKSGSIQHIVQAQPTHTKHSLFFAPKHTLQQSPSRAPAKGASQYTSTRAQCLLQDSSPVQTLSFAPFTITTTIHTRAQLYSSPPSRAPAKGGS